MSKFNHRQRMERKTIRDRFTSDPHKELMLKNPEYMKNVSPVERSKLARYEQNKQTAAEVEEDLRKMGDKYYDLHV